jgi:outer membrane protein OmpA-like peptidoglycan-associated protein
MAVSLAGLALAACSGPDPIERARVAAGRAPSTTLPAVPGEGQAYPNLGSVPARPATTPPEQRRVLEDALVADRANARYVGQPVVPTTARATPSAVPTAPPAAPLEAAGGMLMGAEETAPPPLGAPAAPPIAGAPVTAEALPAPPQATPGPSAEAAAPPAVAMEAMPPPPAPAMPEELSPGARATAAALAAPSPAPPAASLPPAQASSSAPVPGPGPAGGPAAATLAAPPVLLPAERSQAAAPPAEPPRPAAAVPPVPAVVAAPAPMVVAAPPSPAVVIDRGALLAARTGPQGRAYALSFLPGTQTLVQQDRAVLAGLASRGSGATFRITGFSDEAGAGRALDLPLARARVVADALRAAGVPAEAIELGGAARQGPAGRGAEVRLVYSR